MINFRRKRSTAIITIFTMLFSLFMMFTPEKVSAEADTTGPDIHGNTLVLTLPEGKETVTEGDTVEFSIEVTDGSGVSTVIFYFWNSEFSRTQKIYLNKVGDSDVWKGEFQVTQNTANGEWILNSITAYDGINNGSDLSRENENGQFMENADFTVEGNDPDLTGPDIHGNTLVLTLPEGKETVTEGDTVEFSIEVTDGSGVSTVIFYFWNSEFSRTQKIYLNKVGDSDVWKGEFQVTQNTANGEWILNSITAYDGINNESDLSRENENGQFMENADFTVEGNDSDLTGPDIHGNTLVLTLPEGKETVTEGDTVEFSIEVTDGSGVSTVIFYFWNSEFSRTQKIYLNKVGDSDVWKGEFQVTQNTANGEWILNSITAYDGINNGSDLNRENENGQFMENADFTVVPVIYPLGEVALSEDVYTYDGEEKKPAVTVTNEDGEKLEEGKDYNVEYSDNTNIGTAKVTVNGVGDYSGTIEKTFVINPAKVKVGIKLYGHDDIQGTWDAQPAGEGITMKYKVEYKRSTWDKYALLSSDWTGTSYKKANLVDGARYRFKVTPYFEADGEKYEGPPGYSSYIYTLKKIAAPRVSKSSRNYVRVRWTNILGESGYQISRSRYKTKGFTTVKRVSYKYSTTTAKTIRNRTYYYKIRAYKTVDGKRIYAPWSNLRAYKLR